MERINCFITDLDGTLLNDDKGINEYDIVALNKWTDQGNTFIVATGRNFDCYHLLERYNLHPDYIISATGALIHNKQHQCISSFKLNTVIVKQLVTYLDDLKTCDFLVDNLTLKKPYGKSSYDLFANHICQPDFKAVSIDSYSLDDIQALKIFACFYNDELALKAQSDMVHLFPCLNIFHADTNCLEIVGKGIGKGEALKQLAKLEAIDLTCAAAIGDEENDISMFESVGISFAIEQAAPHVKSKASHVASSVADALAQLQKIR